VNARNANARGLAPVARLLPVMLLLLLAGCSLVKKKKAPANLAVTPPLSTTTTEGAALAAPDAAAAPVASAAPAAPVDPLSPADRAAFDQAQATNRDLDWLVKHTMLTNPQKPSEGDVVMKCASLDENRERLEKLTDPESQKVVAESKRLCALEVPILNANHTLKQVSISPSQASRQLMCKFASKDLDKARAWKPRDRRVPELETRFAQTCR
jgi:hypothetical protein